MRSTVEDLGQVVGRAAFILMKNFFGNLFERGLEGAHSGILRCEHRRGERARSQDAVTVRVWGALLRPSTERAARSAGKARRPGGVPPYNKKTARRCERVVVSDKNAGKMPALPRAELWR